MNDIRFLGGLYHGSEIQTICENHAWSADQFLQIWDEYDNRPQRGIRQYREKGTYLNTGIPGTGVYMREKIGGGQAKTRQASASSGSKGYDPEFLRRYWIFLKPK